MCIYTCEHAHAHIYIGVHSLLNPHNLFGLFVVVIFERKQHFVNIIYMLLWSPFIDTKIWIVLKLPTPLTLRFQSMVKKHKYCMVHIEWAINRLHNWTPTPRNKQSKLPACIHYLITHKKVVVVKAVISAGGSCVCL